jgi:agmatine/peptidylarginine deiminase
MRRFIAEFEEQSFTQIIFPHPQTDWNEYLLEAQECFVNIIKSIQKFQACVIVCYDIQAVKSHFQNTKNLYFVEYITDDTWARDCSALSVQTQNGIELLDFTFNAWGGKFEAKKDNAMSSFLTQDAKQIDFVLEGGSVETNGQNLLLTTSTCMLNKNRNPRLSKEQITQKLKSFFGTQEILYLNHGYLAGDDTDSHIDTLARFISTDSLMYVQCTDPNDEHFNALQKMQEELENFARIYRLKLIPLPMTQAIYYEGQRLPATYANFLFVNGAVLVPTYGVKEDSIALEIFKHTFKQREVVGVDAQVLIRQHGSLHCVTMNFA